MTDTPEPLRYWRLESGKAQEFVITRGGAPEAKKHGIDMRKWPVCVELTEAEYEARKGERQADKAEAEAKRRATRIQYLTLGEVEDMIDARIAAKLPAIGKGE